MTQSQFTFDATEKSRLTSIRERIREVMADGRWWTYEELQRELLNRYNLLTQTPSVSARLRELPHDKRVRSGRLWEYKLT